MSVNRTVCWSRLHCHNISMSKINSILKSWRTASYRNPSKYCEAIFYAFQTIFSWTISEIRKFQADDPFLQLPLKTKWNIRIKSEFLDTISEMAGTENFSFLERHTDSFYNHFHLNLAWAQFTGLVLKSHNEI